MGNNFMSDNANQENTAENMASAVIDPPDANPQEKDEQKSPPANSENGETLLTTNSSQVTPARLEVQPQNNQQEQPSVPEKEQQPDKDQLINLKADEYADMKFNSEAENEDITGDDEGFSAGDVILVPCNPYLYSPSITNAGSREALQMNRRKRMFAAKSVLMQNPRNQKRKKRPAYKTVHPKPKKISKQERIRELEILGHSPVRPSKSKSTQANKNDKTEIGNEKTTNTASTNASVRKIPSVARTKFTGEKKVSVAKKESDGDTNAKKSSAGEAAKSIEVYRGPPDDLLPGGVAWPEGWIKVTKQRNGGKTKGSSDSYWYSPGNFKFRSKVEYLKFIKALSLPDIMGDESAAWKIYKNVEL